MAYATLSDLEAYLGLPSGHSDETLLQTLLTRAQEIVDLFTRRTFEAAADSTRHFDAYDDVSGVTLFLDHDLCQVTSITNGDGETLSSGDYVMLPVNDPPYYAIKLLASSGKWWQPDSNGDPENAIAVTGRWAYSVTAPQPITHATIRLAAWMYQQKENFQDIDRAIRAPDGSILLPARLPHDIEALLLKYRRY